MKGKVLDASGQEELFKILLVEDNLDDADLFSEVLREGSSSAFKVVRAETLAAAKQALNKQVLHVVLLDLSLPDSRGLGTLKALRQHDPLIPIIVLTGTDDELLAIRAVQEGAQDYVVKGLAYPKALRRAVRHAITRQRITMELYASREPELVVLH